MYLLLLLLRNPHRSVLSHKKHWGPSKISFESLSDEEKQEYLKYKLNDPDPITWSYYLKFFRSAWSIEFSFWLQNFLLMITSPLHSFIFLILILLNTIMHVFKFVLIIFIWYPYWIIKLFNYIFSKNILEFKLPFKEPNDEWSIKYIFLSQKFDGDLTTKKLWYGLFIGKTNQYACLKPYFVIRCLIDRLLFIRGNLKFIVRLILFLFLVVSSFIWIIVVELCSLPIYPVVLSFNECKKGTITSIIWYHKWEYMSSQDWKIHINRHIYFTMQDYVLYVLSSYALKSGVYKNKDNLFNLIPTEKDRWLW